MSKCEKYKRTVNDIVVMEDVICGDETDDD